MEIWVFTANFSNFAGCLKFFHRTVLKTIFFKDLFLREKACTRVQGAGVHRGKESLKQTLALSLEPALPVAQFYDPEIMT